MIPTRVFSSRLTDPFSSSSRLTALLRNANLKKVAAGMDESRVLVFALYKKECSRVEQNLRRQGFSVGGLSGDMSQSARIEALEAFKTGKTNLLVATDVAARGLDIANVGLVVNYTFPLTIEDYIHRIGRTGEWDAGLAERKEADKAGRSRRQVGKVDHIFHGRGPRARSGRRACARAARQRLRVRGPQEISDDNQKEGAQRLRRVLPGRHPDAQGADQVDVHMRMGLLALWDM